MKQVFEIGDKKQFKKVIGEDDLASFETGMVHPFYSTFALARDAEWTCRQFVLAMKDQDEEGIGHFVNVEHRSPALKGETIEFSATVKAIKGNEIICSYIASVGKRIIAIGEQGQKILKKKKLRELKEELKHG